MSQESLMNPEQAEQDSKMLLHIIKKLKETSSEQIAQKGEKFNIYRAANEQLEEMKQNDPYAYEAYVQFLEFEEYLIDWCLKKVLVQRSLANWSDPTYSVEARFNSLNPVEQRLAFDQAMTLMEILKEEVAHFGPAELSADFAAENIAQAASKYLSPRDVQRYALQRLGDTLRDFQRSKNIFENIFSKKEFIIR